MMIRSFNKKIMIVLLLSSAMACAMQTRDAYIAAQIAAIHSKIDETHVGLKNNWFRSFVGTYYSLQKVGELSDEQVQQELQTIIGYTQEGDASVEVFEKLQRDHFYLGALSCRIRHMIDVIEQKSKGSTIDADLVAIEHTRASLGDYQHSVLRDWGQKSTIYDFALNNSKDSSDELLALRTSSAVQRWCQENPRHYYIQTIDALIENNETTS